MPTNNIIILKLVDIFKLILESSGDSYAKIAFFMFIDSISIPIFLPSEFVVISSYHYIYIGQLNLHITVMCASISSVLGSYVNYYIAKKLGYERVIKYGKYLLINKRKIDFVFKYFIQHAYFIMFIARLMPFIKHVITIPAGIKKINFKYVAVCTYLGTTLFYYYIILLFHIFFEDDISIFIAKGSVTKYLMLISLIIIIGYITAYLIILIFTSLHGKGKVLSNNNTNT